MSDPLARVQSALGARYRLERELGRGGMATVYLATDEKHQRAVAIKVLRPELATALGPERFLREIQIAAGLTHPHILPLHDSGEADGLLYYVTPYIQGEALRDRLHREKQLPLEDALQITTEVADGLGYAHSRGIVHRDIKPENILLSGGHALVADFGIARAVEAAGAERLTESGLAIGTPAYMSPEQAAGSSDVDTRSDLYSLGCVLYEMLSGEPPHTGPSAQAILAKKLSEPVPRISVQRETVPPAVEAALGKALARTPADRFPTASAFSAALTAETPAAIPRPRPRVARTRRWGMAAVAAALVVVAAAVAAVWRLSSGRAPSDLNPNLIAAMPFRVTTGDSTLREFAAQVPDMFWQKVTGQYGPRATDPASVSRAWAAAGGMPDVGLPDAEERRIARTQGAGLLVRGDVGRIGDSVTVTASLERVRDGKVLVPPRTVGGEPRHRYRLLDSLVVLLLAKQFGASAEDIPRLARHPPEAVQAYLEGMRVGNRGPASFRQAGMLLDQALQIDSTFVEAAFWKFDFGERDRTALRFAWQHRDRLSPRDRAMVAAKASLDFNLVHNVAEWVGMFDSVAIGWPEFAVGWEDLGDRLQDPGEQAGIPHADERARMALTRAVTLDPTLAFGWAKLWELSFLDDDSTGIRANLDHVLALADTGHPADPQRWRVALWFGDSTTAANSFRPSDDEDVLQFPAWAHYVLYALDDGRGVAYADRAAESYATNPHLALIPSLVRFGRWILAVWALARGHHSAWLRWRDGPDPAFSDSNYSAIVRLRGALFFGAPEDTAVERAVRYVRALAQRHDTADARVGHCWVTLWNMGHGDTVGARDEERWIKKAGTPICASVIDVLLRQAAHDSLWDAVHRLDSIVRPLPLPDVRFDGVGYPLANLLLARMLRQVGDTAAALSAARRRRRIFSMDFFTPDDAQLLVPDLREEGRLAAMTGDTAGAIKAYTHYLALRSDPDWEPWRQERDQVRRELAALTAERRTR